MLLGQAFLFLSSGLHHVRAVARMAVLAAFGLVYPAAAAVIEVTQVGDEGAGSLRAAVSGAASGDTVRVTIAGTLTLVQGALRIEKDLAIEGVGMDRTILSGSGSSRVIWVDRGVRLELEDLTIADGRELLGGGLFNDGGVVSLVRCSMRSNRTAGSDAADGTGLAGNPGWGGAVYNLGEFAARDCLFMENCAVGGRAASGQVLTAADPTVPLSEGGNGGIGGGGALYNGGGLTLDRCALIANQALGGAGGQGASYTNTTAPGRGGMGGPALGGALANAGWASLVNVTLGLNLATGGAGGNGGTSSNSPGQKLGNGGCGGGAEGGAVYNRGFLLLTHVTCATNDASRGVYGARFSGNCGDWGGGGLSTGDTATAVLANTILAGNTLGGTVEFGNGNAVGPVVDAGGNSSSDARPLLSAPGSRNRVDPALLPLRTGPNGLPGFVPSLGSPALDAVDGALVPAEDQWGTPRPQGVAYDIGALEGGELDPVRILSQPASCTAVLGTGASFAVAVAGFPPPSCQWQKYGVDLPGETNTCLAIASVAARDAGQYRVRVANQFGSVLSEPAVLELVPTLDWLGAALNAPDLPWSIAMAGLPGGPQVFAQTNTTHDGVSAVECLRADPQAPSGRFLQTTVVGPGRLTFWWRASAQIAGQVQVLERVDELYQLDIHAIDLWVQESVDLLEGTNTVVWTNWRRPTSGASETTTVWVDEVSFQPSWFAPSDALAATDYTVNAATTLSLRARPRGTPPFRYQWYHEDLLIAGATHRDLSIADVQSANAGAYRVVVENAVGAETNLATVTVTPAAPSFTRQPFDTAALPGAPAAFAALAFGSEPLAYRWEFIGVALAAGNGPVLVVSNVGPADIGVYRVLVTNDYGAVLSSNAVLALGVPLGEALDAPELDWSSPGENPWFGQALGDADRPHAAHVMADAVANEPALATTVEGPGRLTFDWRANLVTAGNSLRVRVDGVTGVELGEAEARVLGEAWQNREFHLGSGSHTLTWELERQYGSGPIAAWLDRVRFVPGGVAPSVTLWPSGAVLTAGGELRLSAAFTGSPPILIEWRRDGTPIPGATNAILSIPRVTVDWTGRYECNAWNDYGTNTSNAADIRVTPSLAEGMDTPWLTWSGPAVGEYHTQTAVTHDGIDAVQGKLACASSGQGSLLTFLRTSATGPGIFRAFFKLFAHPGGGWLRFEVDGRTVATYTGDLDWQPLAYPLDAGVHAVTWVFGHSPGECPGDEFAWIDAVRIDAGGTPPAVRIVPSLLTVAPGKSALLKAEVSGTGPFTCRWARDGQVLPWAVSPTLIVPEMRASDAGRYSVVVGNDWGESADEAQLGLMLSIPESVDAPELLWRTNTFRPWFGQSFVTHDGVDAAQSGVASPSSGSQLSLTLVGPGTLTFWWKVSSATNVGLLECTLSEDLAISGEVDWQPRTVYLRSGSGISVNWYYTGNGSAEGGLNAGWLDEVRFTPGGTAPIVVEPPASQWVYAGSSVTFANRVVGTPSLYYTWKRDGRTLNSGPSANTLHIASAATNQAGWYTAIVANNYGAVTNGFYLAVHPAGTLPSAPRFFDARALPEAGCELELGVAAGWTFRIQWSADLIHWQDRGVRFALDPLQIWTDIEEGDSVPRFYRALAP